MKHVKTNLSDEPLDRDSLFSDCDTLIRDAESDADFNDQWDEWPDEDMEALH